MKLRNAPSSLIFVSSFYGLIGEWVGFVELSGTVHVEMGGPRFGVHSEYAKTGG